MLCGPRVCPVTENLPSLTVGLEGGLRSPTPTDANQ